MNRQLSFAVLAGLLVTACSEMPTGAPIEDLEGRDKTQDAAPITDAGQPGRSAAAESPPAAKAADKTAIPSAKARATSKPTVETHALPSAAGEQVGALSSASPTTTGAAATMAHKDPSSPLAKRVIYFDYDSATINTEYQPLLDSHAAYLKANKSLKVVLQGHADERGSREYNLALGQRRSESIRQAMSLLGVMDEQMEAVSMGEEKPAVEGHDEAAWKMNRRCEIHYVGE